MVPDVRQPRQCVVGDERAEALCFNLFVFGCGQQVPLNATDADVAAGGVGAAGIRAYLGFERLQPVTFAQQGRVLAMCSNFGNKSTIVLPGLDSARQWG